MNFVKKRINSSSFPEIRERFAEIYFRTFPANERRRVSRSGILGEQDDGLLTGLPIEDLLKRANYVFEAFFVENTLAAFLISFELKDGIFFGDYVAVDPLRKDLVGLGQKINSDWHVNVEKKNGDIVGEVESPHTAPDPNEPGITPEEKVSRRKTVRIRTQRLFMYEREGWYFLENIDYHLPGGAPMTFGIRPSPSRKIIEVNGNKMPSFETGELERIIQQVRSTYETK